jgi:hypothetical protein
VGFGAYKKWDVMKQQMGAEDTTLNLDLGPNSTTERVQETEDLSN